MPLIWAAAESHFEVVRYLLVRGAEIKKGLASGFTPLLYAVRQGHLEVAKDLIQNGADVTEAAKVNRGRKTMSDGTSPLPEWG